MCADYRGCGYPKEVVKEALRLLALKKEYPNNINLSYSSIAEQLGVKSHNTISNWEALSMDDDSILSRKKEKGHNRKLSEHDELVIAGFVLDASKTHHPSRSIEVLDFILKRFHVRLSPSWLTRFQDRHHLAKLLPSNMLKGRCKSRGIDALIRFLIMRRLNVNSFQSSRFSHVFFQSRDGRQHKLCFVCQKAQEGQWSMGTL
jgi:transposase